MEEGKIFVYAKKDGKNLIAFKTNPYNTLNIIRDELIKKIKFSNFLFQKEDSFLIEKENEDQYLLCEIIFNENNFEIKACKNTNSGSNYDLNIILITVYLNNKVFYKGKISKYETLINFLKTLPNKIPADSKLLSNGYEIDINEVDQIEEILDNNNNIYFISSIQIRNIPKKEEKEEIQSKEKIIIQFGKNTKIEKLDVSIKLNELRKELIKKNYGNFDFIYKYDGGETILDRNVENDWRIEEIIDEKNNSKFIYLKVEDEKEAYNINNNNNNNEIFITFYNNNNKLFEKKLNINFNLSEIRNIIKNQISRDFLFLKNNQRDEIEKNNENNFRLNEIKNSNNNVYINYDNISLFDLRRKYEEIPNNAKFFCNNCIINNKEEKNFSVKDVLENNEFINLKIEEENLINNNCQNEIQSEVENIEIKYKIYLNGKFLKFLKQFKKATLDDIRNILSQQITNNELFYTSKDKKILIENENKWALKDYCKSNNKIYLKTIKKESNLKK